MKRIVALVCTVILVLSVAATAMASGIDDKKKELNNVNQGIKKTKEQLEQIKKEQSQVTAQLQAIEDELEAKEAELTRVEQQLKDTQASLETTRQELEEAKKAAMEYEKLIADRLRAMYMTSVSSYFELLLESRSVNDFIDRIQMVKQLLAYDNEVLTEMEAYRDQVDEKRAALEEKERIIGETRTKIAQQKKEIELKKQERQQLLAKLEDQEVAYEKDLDELEKTSKELEKKIQEMLKELERKRQQQKYTGGVLAWPVPGFYNITSPFGYRIHPIYKTRRMHTGIDIGSNYVNGKKYSIYGHNFVAGASGEVIFSGWYGGYGNCVIISHGGGITTLYAHGSKRLVSKGQYVKRGQPVMKVGSTGASTGAHAHFEVRKNGTPVNPMSYLGKK